MAVVQGNVERERRLEEQARVRGVAESHTRETKALADTVRRGDVPQPDVVLWPENSLDGNPEHYPELGALVADAVRELDSPLLVGAILEAPDDRAYTAGQLWLPGQGPVVRVARRVARSAAGGARPRRLGAYPASLAAYRNHTHGPASTPGLDHDQPFTKLLR
ncbi:hypothetical protein ACFV1X_26530 [Streptomyces coelicoflavus]|uniref:hypothetical protein n=1 Tax=Streptomyces coelicoflavus TaxID=285562 RepID=UPI0036CF0657